MTQKVKMIKPPKLIGWPTGKGGFQTLHEGGFFEPSHCDVCYEAYYGKSRRIKK